MKISIYTFIQDARACFSEPCLNGGVCVGDLGQYICECARGFVGIICEIGRQWQTAKTISYSLIVIEKER